MCFLSTRSPQHIGDPQKPSEHGEETPPQDRWNKANITGKGPWVFCRGQISFDGYSGRTFCGNSATEPESRAWCIFSWLKSFLKHRSALKPLKELMLCFHPPPAPAPRQWKHNTREREKGSFQREMLKQQTCFFNEYWRKRPRSAAGHQHGHAGVYFFCRTHVYVVVASGTLANPGQA